MIAVLSIDAKRLMDTSGTAACRMSMNSFKVCKGWVSSCQKIENQILSSSIWTIFEVSVGEEITDQKEDSVTVWGIAHWQLQQAVYM